MPSITRQFHIGDILAVLLQHDLSLRGRRGAELLQDYMVGRELNSVERGQFAADIRFALQEQFGDLLVFAPEELPPRECLADWLYRREREFGEYFTVQPMETRVPGDNALRFMSDDELVERDEWRRTSSLFENSESAEPDDIAEE